MGNQENFEATKSLDAGKEHAAANLSSYALDRSQAPTNAGREQQNALVERGVLPAVGFIDMSSDAHTGTPAKAAELKDSGVKVEHDKDGTTRSEFPNGVKVETAPGRQLENSKITLGPTVLLEASPPNRLNEKGEVRDAHGKLIAKTNADGGVTVDSGKGFYTHNPDGSIDRESVIRSRDGKNFEVLDTNTPLGNLRPGDVVKRDKH